MCVRRDGRDVVGIFRGMAAQHIYAPDEAMAPGMDEYINGYRITGIAPNPSQEHSIRFEDVGRLLVKPVSATAVKKIAESKNLPEDVERLIKRYGGKKSRRMRKLKRQVRKTRRAVP